MQILIADDEPELRRNLRERLQRLWPQADEILEAGDGLSALAMIQQHRPKTVFLDIRMPGLDGMQVAGQLPADCQLVFVTAYDQYAVQAFERHAVDFLLKPYTDQRLQETVERIRRLQTNNIDQSGLREVLQQLGNLGQRTTHLQWIRAGRGDDVTLIHVDDILYFQAGDKYTSVYTRDGESVIRLSLKELEEQLDGERFWRIHRGTIVNVGHIEGARRTLDGSYHIALKGCQETLKSSRAYAHLFKQM